jgi:YgiT-type zinc finger domain-containing protein
MGREFSLSEATETMSTASIRCYYCGGATEPQLVDDLYAEGGVYVAVEHVPADVCRQCGERYYSPQVTERLVSLTGQAQRCAVPGSRANVFIYDFAAAGGAASAGSAPGALAPAPS